MKATRLLIAALTVAAGVTALPRPVLASTCSWHHFFSNLPQTDVYLAGVSAAAPNDAWAVGTALSGGGAVATHFDGTSWEPVATPDPRYRRLEDVVARSATNAWAVEWYGTDDQPVIEHWNGSRWADTNGPTIVDPDGNPVFDAILLSVSSDAHNDVWIAGSSSSGLADTDPLVEHFDGTKWTATILPDVPGYDTVQAGDILALSPTDVWVSESASNSTTGTDFLSHFDGTSWTMTADAGGALAASSATNVWATGERGSSVERYDGSAWSASETWLASASGGVAQWNGSTWTVYGGKPLNGSINAMAPIPGADRVWAVSYSGKLSHGYIVRGNCA